MSRFFHLPITINPAKALAVLKSIAAIACLALTPSATIAQESSSSRMYEVRNDRGGTLRARLFEIQNLRQSGQPVRISGSVCQSTCTMFLGLPQTCISPQTEFGFHGPSSFGIPLSPEVFEQASRIIADHYPDAIKQWYMTKARHSIWGLHRIPGSQIIDWGFSQPC